MNKPLSQNKKTKLIKSTQQYFKDNYFVMVYPDGRKEYDYCSKSWSFNRLLRDKQLRRTISAIIELFEFLQAENFFEETFIKQSLIDTCLTNDEKNQFLFDASASFLQLEQVCSFFRELIDIFHPSDFYLRRLISAVSLYFVSCPEDFSFGNEEDYKRSIIILLIVILSQGRE